MAETSNSAQAQTGPEPAAAATELDARRLEQLTDLVYKLLQQELIVTRERRGEAWNRPWR